MNNLRKIARHYNERQFAFVRCHYGKARTETIARVLGVRHKEAVFRVALRLGLCTPCVRWTQAKSELIRRMVAEGACNPHIAAACSEEGKRPVDRHSIADFRRRLKLPPSRGAETCQRCKDETREATRKQLEAAGLPNIGYLRVEAYKKYARACGWPEDLAPRAVKILNALWQRGPMTRREIAEAVGDPKFLRGLHPRSWLADGGHVKCGRYGGSHLAYLMHRGLVVRSGQRVVKLKDAGLRKRVGKCVYLYSLPLNIERNLSPSTCEANHESAQTGPDAA